MLGTLVNAIFLDVADQDARRLERLNSLLAALPEESRNGLRPVELMVMRPSQDLGRLASDYEVRLPRSSLFDPQPRHPRNQETGLSEPAAGPA